MFEVRFVLGTGWFIACNGKFWDGYFFGEFEAIDSLGETEPQAAAELFAIHSSVE